MALLQDGLVSGLDDILQVDSGVADVARAEGISIDHKLNLAQRDCEIKIAQFVVNHGLETRLGSQNNLPRLDRVVVGDGLKRWFTLHSLELFYSDAYYRVLNDRYGKKLDHFSQLESESWNAYTDTGIACVYNPIPRGEIAHLELNQSPIGSGIYDVAIAWIDSSGNSGSLSNCLTILVADGEGFTVIPAAAPLGVTGYDVYIGEGGATPRKQTDLPVSISTTYAANVLSPGHGRPTEPTQNIDFVLRKSRIFTRG